MPRQARTTSASCVYHTILRGVNKQYLFSAYEEGIGPRILSRLTGVPYSIVQRATSGTSRNNGMVFEPLSEDEEFKTQNALLIMTNVNIMQIYLANKAFVQPSFRLMPFTFI